jgi:predicted adenine nucleotide alpha hydrolase (AANH) superfamily ATPase
VDSLKRKYNSDTQVDIFYYNPNIHPRSEYIERLNAVKQVFHSDIEKVYPTTKLIICDWTPREYFEKINGHTNKPVRCPQCWSLRLNKAFEYAKTNKYDAVSSTMITSEYMDRDTIEKVALKYMNDTKVPFIHDMEFNQELKTGGFYKQNYCGCTFSLTERMQEKYSE